MQARSAIHHVAFEALVPQIMNGKSPRDSKSFNTDHPHGSNPDYDIFI